jgi:putative acetyltransferase
MIKIVRTNSNNADFHRLITLLDLEISTRYGDIQKKYIPYNKIDSLGTVVIAYNEDQPVGCGCFRYYDDDTAEIKRMFVKPEYRGTGIAEQILLELEKWAVENGFSRSILETGIKQPEAIRFYLKLGYQKIDNYDQYVGYLNSVCMSKCLTQRKIQ